MAFEVAVTHYEATHAGSKKQSRQVCALMDIPEDSCLMENVNVTAFHDGRAIVTIQVAKVLTPEEWQTLREILHLDPVLTEPTTSR